MSTPAISVIMAVYNGAELIGETLHSLQQQRFGDFELILVDDCSTDDTQGVVRSFGDARFKLFPLATNQGVVAARNHAMTKARGRYIAALDHDDLCHPDRFARQVAYLDAHPATVLIGTAASILEDNVVGPGSLAPVTTPALIEWLLRIENPLVWSSVMMRGDVARKLDPFNRPSMHYAEDFDVYHRIARFGTIARLDAELVTYRRHRGSTSQRHVEAMTNKATEVLAASYADAFGDEAAGMADLIVRYVMGQQPVPDRATFQRLGDALITLQDDFLARRIGLRTGRLDLADAVAVRPDHLGLGYAGIDDLVMSRLVGGARSVQRRLAARASG
jgi:glycosyltransferase involved in cell wall biosynthesis